MKVNYDDLEVEITAGGWHLYYYNKELFTGEAFELNSQDKTLLSECHFINGTAWGPTKIWYDTGQLKSQTNYYLDQKQGEAFQWFENGHLKSGGYYKMGTLLRKKEYDETGTIISNYKIEEDSPETLKHLTNWEEISLVYKYVDSEYLPIVTYLSISSVNQIKELLLAIQNKHGIMHEYYGFELGENNTLTFYDLLSFRENSITLSLQEFITFFEPWLNQYFAQDPNEKKAIETLVKNIRFL